MANWKYSLDFSGFYKDAVIPVEEKGKRIAQIVQHTFPSAWFDICEDDYVAEIAEITERFENITGYDDVSPVKEFDDVMSELYDFGDSEVEPFDEWPCNKMAWVKTR